MISCVAEGNAGFGFGAATVAKFIFIQNCATFNNTGGGIDPLFSSGGLIGNITYTATAFISATNFALNSATNGGALLRAAGFPGALPAGTSVGYLDIGAVQHQDPPVIFRKNTALAGFGFPMFDTAGNLKTGLTITAQRVLDGGAIAAMANAVSEISAGAYKIDLAAADVNANTGTLLFTAPGAASAPFSFITQTFAKNQTVTGFSFPMRSATTGSLLTGLTVTAQRVLDGGAVTTMANAVTEVSLGIYAINLAAADVNCNSGLFLFTATGSAPTVFTFVTQA
jgi:hypothetical protein